MLLHSHVRDCRDRVVVKRQLLSSGGTAHRAWHPRFCSLCRIAQPNGVFWALWPPFRPLLLRASTGSRPSDACQNTVAISGRLDFHGTWLLLKGRCLEDRVHWREKMVENGSMCISGELNFNLRVSSSRPNSVGVLQVCRCATLFASLCCRFLILGFDM